MADEIHTTREPDGTTHTTTVVDREPRRGGMGMGLILIAALLIAAFIAFQFLSNDNAQTGAITGAADKVGDAAQDVGHAAEDALKK